MALNKSLVVFLAVASFASLACGASVVSKLAGALRVKTPEQYEQLKQGQFDEKYHTIFVEPEAHPNVILEVKHFANTKFKEIHFTDKIGNTVALYPLSQHLSAFYTAGEGLYFGLPTSYRGYFLVSDHKANVTAAEIDYVLQFKNAVRLNFLDQSQVGYGLLQRIEKFKELEHLKHITVRVHRDVIGVFDVKPFLHHLKALQSTTLVVDTVKPKTFKEFVGKQQETDVWKFKVIGRWIRYVKKIE